MRRTMEKTSKGALPVSSLSYSFPRLSSKPLSMPLVSPTLAGLRIIMLAGGCERITALLYETAEEEEVESSRRRRPGQSRTRRCGAT